MKTAIRDILVGVLAGSILIGFNFVATPRPVAPVIFDLPCHSETQLA